MGFRRKVIQQRREETGKGESKFKKLSSRFKNGLREQRETGFTFMVVKGDKAGEFHIGQGMDGLNFLLAHRREYLGFLIRYR